MNKSCQKTCIVCGNTFLDKSINHGGRYCSSKCKIWFHYHKDIEKSRNRFRKWREKNIEKERKRCHDYHIWKKKTDPTYLQRRRDNAKKFRLANPEKVWESHDKEHFDGNKAKTLERDNLTCQVCDYLGKNKFDTNLAIHHKDGNRKNNKMSNLITLCDSCHMYVTGYQHFLGFYKKFPDKKDLIDNLVKSLN